MESRIGSIQPFFLWVIRFDFKSGWSPNQTRNVDINAQCVTFSVGIMWRTITATAGGIITGLINLLSTRNSGPRIELGPGDLAPNFTLVGSDGRWYRLSDFRGTDVVVLAWFPKAFTPG